VRHRTLLLALMVLAALSVGYLAGYRARVSEEVVKVYPRPMHPPVPDDLGAIIERQIDAILDSR